MKIAKTNSVSSFGSIKISSLIKCFKDSPILAKAQTAKSYLTDIGIGNEKNIDIIINRPFWHKYSDIVAVIVSKKQGQPISPHAEMAIPIGNKKKKKENFINWIKAWDYSYSEAGIKKMIEMQQKAVEILRKINP